MERKLQVQVLKRTVIQGSCFVMVEPDKEQSLFVPAVWSVFHILTGEIGKGAMPIGGRNIRNHPVDSVATY